VAERGASALIIDSYDAIGAAAEAADDANERGDFAGRWRAACHGVRVWALEHPHEYALVYGSPVPGYSAPQDTTGPASQVTLVLAAVVRDAAASGALGNPFVPRRFRSKPVRRHRGWGRSHFQECRPMPLCVL
jgi:Tetracyclin repressor-like, C-terminal domain